MKRVTAIIRPIKLKDVERALREEGVEDFSLTEVEGCGQQRGYIEFYQPDLHFRPKIKVEILVNEESLEEVLLKITRVARLDFYGDGRIFVAPGYELIEI